jgi:hypothetical protein
LGKIAKIGSCATVEDVASDDDELLDDKNVVDVLDES